MTETPRGVFPSGRSPFSKESDMIIQFTPSPKAQVTPATNEGSPRTRAAVFSILTPTKAPDGTVNYAKSGYCARFSGSPEFRGRPDPWDGGDAA